MEKVYYIVHSTKPTMAFSKEKALEALKELGELGDNIFPEVQKHDFHPVHITSEHVCFLYRYEKVVMAASDAKEIENFCVAKKNVVDNILVEPMPRYSVNVSLKFYTEAKTLAMVELTAAEVAEECYKIYVENQQTLPSDEVLEKFMVAAKRYKCDHGVQDFVTAKELATNTELSDAVAKVMGQFGYVVTHNQSAILHGENPRASRFYSSQPDMAIYHLSKHCAAIIVDGTDAEPGVVAATESKRQPNREGVGQLLAGMEKVAGDIVFLHLSQCSTLLEYVNVYGLMIDYSTVKCSVYQMLLDFKLGETTIFCERQPLELSNGLNRMLTTLARQNEIEESQ